MLDCIGTFFYNQPYSQALLALQTDFQKRTFQFFGGKIRSFSLMKFRNHFQNEKKVTEENNTILTKKIVENIQNSALYRKIKV